MEKLQFENEQFILYSPDSLKYITDNMQNILAKSFKYYKILFDVDIAQLHYIIIGLYFKNDFNLEEQIKYSNELMKFCKNNKYFSYHIKQNRYRNFPRYEKNLN